MSDLAASDPEKRGMAIASLPSSYQQSVLSTPSTEGLAYQMAEQFLY